MKISEGELFNNTNLEVSKRRIIALGFFENVVISTKRGSSDDDRRGHVEVTERADRHVPDRRRLLVRRELHPQAQISQNNLFGRGQTLALQVQWSSLRQLFLLRFVEPYFLDTQWTFAFDLYATEGIYTTFTRRAVGGSMTWGYELNGLAPWWSFAKKLEDMRLFATYTNERVDVSATGIAAVSANQLPVRHDERARLSLPWDKRDNRLFPTRGFFLSGSARVRAPLPRAEALFGDEVNLFRATPSTRGRTGRSGWGSSAGRSSPSATSATGTRTTGSRSPSATSSAASTRSAATASLDLAGGVRPDLNRPDAERGALHVGGNKQVVLNFELEFPLFEKVGIRGVVFFDMGNAFAPGDYTDPGRAPVALQVRRLRLPLVQPDRPAPLRVGHPARPPAREPGERRRLHRPALDFQFTIGNFF